MGPTWGPPGSCRPQMGPMLAPWTLLSGLLHPDGGHQGSHKAHQAEYSCGLSIYCPVSHKQQYRQHCNNSDKTPDFKLPKSPHTSPSRTSLSVYDVSYHRALECLFNILFGRTWMKHQRPALLAVCEVNTPVSSKFPSKGPVMWK